MGWADLVALSSELPRPVFVEAGSTIACLVRIHVPGCRGAECIRDLSNGHGRHRIQRVPRPLAFVIRVVGVSSFGAGTISVLGRLVDSIARRAGAFLRS